MSLTKGNLSIPFGQGIETKQDSKQIPPGKMLVLQNTIFQQGNLLQKRNGFGPLPSLSITDTNTLGTFGGSLIAVGKSLYNFAPETEAWYNKGAITSVETDVVPLVRSATSQSEQDSVVTPEGLSCTVWTDSDGTSKYQINDTLSSQIIVSATSLPTTATQARVFLLGSHFIITFLATVSAASHLQFIAVPTFNPGNPGTAVDIGLQATSLTAGYDGYVANNNLYVSWSDIAPAIKTARITSSLVVSSAVTIVTRQASYMSVTCDLDSATPVIWLCFFDPNNNNLYAAAYGLNLNTILAPTILDNDANIIEVTSVATFGLLTAFYQISNTYPAPSVVRSDYIRTATCPQALGLGAIGNVVEGSNIVITTANQAGRVFIGETIFSTGGSIPTGTVITAINGKTLTLSAAGTFDEPGAILVATKGTPMVMLRSVGLATKAFILNTTKYVGVAYGVGTDLLPTPGGGAFQPTYFLSDSVGNLVAKLAYTNGGGYAQSQVLPGVSLSGFTAKIGYLYKDLLTSVNKSQGVANVNGIYSQTGINLVSWTLNDSPMPSSEIGNNLHLGGGFVWMYDGTRPVEHNFHVYPEDIQVSTATGSGDLINQQYYYQVTYEWTDAQGNIHRSAPSAPVGQLTTTANSTNTLIIPTLRLTYKTGTSKVRIVVYRWSTTQENYYQITSITSPTLNDPTVDYVTIIDTKSDSDILGNQLIYTTGGVVENIAMPSVSATTLYKSRLVIIDAEDKNLLWYSKQVIQTVPVEPSDLFTQYIAPTAGAQGSTGVNTAISAMDDKLIIFKRNAIYYMTGTGPDNTGANNDFSEPTYITSTAGCTNAQSIVFMPQGLMFQSDKGIWLLGRDLSTSYIGAPVEQYNSAKVLSAINVPGTNQVRFTLDNDVTLMYDYYYGQWGTFVGVPAISSTLYTDLHTYVNTYGQVFQETPGKYTDGSNPVLMSFTTAWFALAGLQGFERAYFFYLLGTYLSPHKLSVSLAFDFDPSIVQTSTISPDNHNAAYGLEAGPYGSGDPYGGVSNIEQWRIFLQQQKCQSFQVTIAETFDSSFETVPGAGLTLSGINLVVGIKKSYTTIKAARSVG